MRSAFYLFISTNYQLVRRYFFCNGELYFTTFLLRIRYSNFCFCELMIRLILSDMKA